MVVAEDLTKLTYPKLKQKAAREGVDASGSKSEITERLIRARKGDKALKISHAETDNSEISPDTIPVSSPKSQIITTSEKNEINCGDRELKDRVDKLLNEINYNIFQGRATAVVELSDPNAPGFHFIGGARQNHWITLKAPDSLILKEARFYLSKCTVAKNKQVSDFRTGQLLSA